MYDGKIEYEQSDMACWWSLLIEAERKMWFKFRLLHWLTVWSMSICRFYWFVLNFCLIYTSDCRASLAIDIQKIWKMADKVNYSKPFCITYHNVNTNENTLQSQFVLIFVFIKLRRSRLDVGNPADTFCVCMIVLLCVSSTKVNFNLISSVCVTYHSLRAPQMSTTGLFIAAKTAFHVWKAYVLCNECIK